MQYIFFGEPGKKVISYAKNQYIPRAIKLLINKSLENDEAIDISNMTYKIEDVIDHSFDGNIVEYVDLDNISYSLHYEPYSEISSKGSIADSQFCLGNIQNVTNIYKLSRNFTRIATSISSACMLESISADGISSVQQYSFSGMRNLINISLPNLLSVDQTVFQSSYKIQNIDLRSINQLSGTVFMALYALKKIDFGTTENRTTMPTLEIDNDIYLNYMFSQYATLSIYVPENLLQTEVKLDGINRWSRLRKKGVESRKITFIGQ